MNFEKDFKVSDPARIAWILKSLKDDRQLVSIDFRESGRSQISTIVEVDREKGILSIDGFSGTTCGDLALAGELFALKASLNGVDVTVEGLAVESVVTDSDGPIYLLHLPKVIQYVQRRECFRARVTGLIRVPVEGSSVLKDRDQSLPKLSEVQLSNISAEGCRLEVRGTEESFTCEVGDLLLLNIHIPNHEVPLPVKVSVCHKRHLARSKLWYVGCKFTKLKVTSENAVNRFVSELQLLERRQEEMFTR